MGHSTSAGVGGSTRFVTIVAILGIIVLAIAGATQHDSTVLLLMVGAISALVMITAFSDRYVPHDLYPFVIFLVALALLLQAELISRYLIGYDLFIEDYVFRLTSSRAFWDASLVSAKTDVMNYNAMLSVTVLPTVYWLVSGLDGQWVFKLMYLFPYSLVPVVLYGAFRGRFGRLESFLAVFYFVAFPRFYSEERRVMIGELFFALIVLLILNAKIAPNKRWALLLVFGFSLVVSHYATAYMFLMCMAFVWICTNLSTRHGRGGREAVTGGLVLLMFVIAFTWYGYVSASPSETLWDLVARIGRSFFSDFLNVGSRGGTISEFVSPDLMHMSAAYIADFVISKIPYVLIPIGLIIAFKKGRAEPVTRRYNLFALAYAIMLFLVLVVPLLAPAFLAQRFYHASLLVLAPFVIVGGGVSLKWILAKVNRKGSKLLQSRNARLRIIAAFLVVIFIFKVGAVYQITGEVTWGSQSISFGTMRTSSDTGVRFTLYERYVPEQDVFGALWLGKAATTGDVYADVTATKRVLMGYGGTIMDSRLQVLSSTTHLKSGTYVYIRYANSVEGIWVSELEAGYSTPCASGICQMLLVMNEVYSNGGTEVFRVAS